MQALFAAAVERFGRVDIVVANAGIMESRRFFDFEVDEGGKLREDGAGRVIDVNLKGTMNTLRLAVFHMKDNTPDASGWRGSVVLVSSTSGYFGGTEVVSYISSKHGVIGLLRASHAPRPASRRARQCRGALYHADAHHRGILGGVEGRGVADEYAGGCGDGDCAYVAGQGHAGEVLFGELLEARTVTLRAPSRVRFRPGLARTWRECFEKLVLSFVILAVILSQERDLGFEWDSETDISMSRW
ncbi:hypothetical protein G7046_g9701 [Stylonectria norvegica]|nr:hypothetical protein G7046_g9701 [Stylonectria norvegica]